MNLARRPRWTEDLTLDRDPGWTLLIQCQLCFFFRFFERIERNEAHSFLNMIILAPEWESTGLSFFYLVFIVFGLLCERIFLILDAGSEK